MAIYLLMMMRYIIAIFCLLINFCLAVESQNVAFLIISQNNSYNENLANDLKESLIEQSYQLQLNEPKIYISNKDFKTPADWTITPVISPLLKVIEKGIEWIIFLEDRSNVTLKLLLDGLKKYDFNKGIWIGHALYDSEATIIHHFAFHEDPTFFKYPNLASGIAVSVPLLKRIKTRMKDGFKKLDFHIDPDHEFALFVYDVGNGPMIQHDDLFCSKAGPSCATYPNKFQPCGKADISSIYFAIKTCQKFHNNRVKVVKKTWYEHTVKSTFFSDIEDPDIPTTSLGVLNTDQGHCQKTIEILQYGLDRFNKDPRLQWLALVDDDTILSVYRMASLATCYNNTSQPTILGERYRFGAQGFNYPTGGAGILINRAALKILALLCNCPHLDAPDDMVLGSCAQEYGVLLAHVPQMHQARPTDYAEGRLATNDAVSFHKHWMIDPIETYENWFGLDDYNIPDQYYAKTEL